MAAGVQMRHLAGIVVVVVLAFPGTSRADYDMTKWGMTLGELEDIYPGGGIIRPQDGTTHYEVVRPVAGFPTALLEFVFTREKGLDQVLVLFPEQASTVDLATGAYQHMLNDEAVSTRNRLRESLTKKYGKPIVSDDMGAAWSRPDGDWITLSISRLDAKRSTAGILYEHPPADGSERTKGL